MNCRGKGRRLAQGGAVLASVVLCLLVTSVYGGSPTRRRSVDNSTTLSLNNSVVAPPERIIDAVPSASPHACSGGDCLNNKNNNTSEEQLLKSKGNVGSAGDPLVRTNQIGLTRYAATEENLENVPANENIKPEPTKSSFDERISQLSAAVNRDLESHMKAYSSSIFSDVSSTYSYNIQPSTSAIYGLEVAEAQDAAASVWQHVPSGHTPELPNKYSKIEGYVSTMSYEDNAEPSKYSKESTKLMEDGTTTGFTSTSRFSYSESITPSIKPSSVTATVSIASTFNIQLSGSSKTGDDDDEEEDGEEKPENSENKETIISSTNNATIVSDTLPSASNNTIQIVNANETQEITSSSTKTDTIINNSSSIQQNTTLDDILGLNKTEISSKLLLTEKENKRENESLNKNSSDPEISTKVIEDLEQSMASQVVTIAAAVSTTPSGSTTRRRYRPSSTTSTPSTSEESQSRRYRTSTTTSVPETSSEPQSRRNRPISTTSVPVSSDESQNSTNKPTSRGSTRYAFATTLRVSTSPPEDVFISASSEPVPTVTTYRGPLSVGNATTTRVRGNSTRQRLTTTVIPPVTSSTTQRPQVEDTQGEGSTLECTTMEEVAETTTTLVTSTPASVDEDNTVVHRTSTYRSRSSTSTTRSGGRTRNPPTGRPRTRPPKTQTSYEETTTMEMTTMTMPGSVDTGSGNIETGSPSSSSEVEYSEMQTEAYTKRKNQTTSTTPKFEENTVIDETDAPPTEIPSSVKAFLRLTIATTWEELCRGQEDFRQGIATLLAQGTGREVTSDHVIMLNDEQCLEPPPTNPGGIPLHVYLSDDKGGYDMQLTEAFPEVWAKDAANKLQITCVDLRYTKDEQNSPATAEHANVVAVIAIAGVAVGCLLLLVVLMMVMRKRQKRYNYGQRCTPVSLDAYSLDSVSVYNSVRRKGHRRASKRSYGNPAFDDPDSPTHPVNFAGLANLAGDTSALHEEFALVPVVSARIDELPVGTEAKNRYANVIPLPESRVPLTRRGSDPVTEYINANFIRGPKNAPKYYIACQAPLESTVCDFWRMIWEHQSKVILMLTDLEENGVEKCADYLPPSEVLDCNRRFGDFHVTLKKREVRDKYAVSTLQLKNMESNLWREITHVWFFGWPSTGVPEDASSIIAFIIEARAFMKANTGPTVVHCSPGTGRTGTVLACDLCIREFEQSRIVDVPRVVHRLRRDRAGSVQTREQYVFIYQVLNTYATKLTGGAMDSF